MKIIIVLDDLIEDFITSIIFGLGLERNKKYKRIEGEDRKVEGGTSADEVDHG